MFENLFALKQNLTRYGENFDIKENMAILRR